MSDLVGTLIGGFLSLVGSFGALFVRDWLNGRGDITPEIKDCVIKIFRHSAPNSADRSSTLSSLKSLREADLNDVDELSLNAVLGLHNKKDISVGLMEMHILLKGRQQRLTCTPDARIRYMGLQGEQKQEPFQAATLPAQQVVIMRLEALFTEEAKIAQLATCDQAKLRVRLSRGGVIERDMFVESSFR
jgi:hypothetical protein